MTCLYKNNGAVSCVGGNVLFIWSLYLPIRHAPWCAARYTRYFDTKLHWILPWADINRNCNTFLQVKSGPCQVGELPVSCFLLFFFTSHPIYHATSLGLWKRIFGNCCALPHFVRIPTEIFFHFCHNSLPQRSLTVHPNNQKCSILFLLCISH